MQGEPGKQDRVCRAGKTSIPIRVVQTSRRAIKQRLPRRCGHRPRRHCARVCFRAVLGVVAAAGSDVCVSAAGPPDSRSGSPGKPAARHAHFYRLGGLSGPRLPGRRLPSGYQRFCAAWGRRLLQGKESAVHRRWPVFCSVSYLFCRKSALPLARACSNCIWYANFFAARPPKAGSVVALQRRRSIAVQGVKQALQGFRCGPRSIVFRLSPVGIVHARQRTFPTLPPSSPLRSPEPGEGHACSSYS